MDVINLDDALSALDAKQKRDSTWDDRALHVSDLSLCKRQVWARRNGLLEEYEDLDNFLQMNLGLKYESILCEALDAAGIPYEYQVPIEGKLLGYDIVGTADFVFRARGAVLDAKCTVFWTGWVGRGDTKKKQTKIPEEPKMGYRIQATAYAMALGMPKYGVQSVCRSTGKRATFWYDTAGLAQTVGKELVNMQDTQPGDAEPVTSVPPWYTFNEDGRSWQCDFCKYGACENNRNKELQFI